MRPGPASSVGPLLPSLVRLALSIAGSNLLQRGVGVVDALMVSRLRAAELAIVGLSQLLILFLIGFVHGLGVGCTVAVAYHTGAGNRDRRGRAIRASLLLGVAVVAMSAVGLTYMLFPSQWVALFTSDHEVLAHGRTLMWIMALLQPPLALALALSGALRGAGETAVVLYAAIVGGWFVRIPVAFFLGVQLGLGLVAAWLTMWLDWWTRDALVLFRFRRLRWAEIGL